MSLIITQTTLAERYLSRSSAMPEQRQPYVYEPLRSSSIRLLKIRRDSTESSIKCRFQIYKTSHCPPYIALSYTWGSTREQQEISLDGGSFSVRQNLWDFLQVANTHHRNEEGDLPLLWIDQICI
jgi:Heterokaryon incompatibility protein (HET)